MKVTQEKLPDSQIGLEIEITAESSKNSYEKVIKELSSSLNIPGFRRGKVPRPILLQRVGTQRIKAAALEKIIQDGVKKAIEQESIDSLGDYKLRSNFDELVQQFTPGQPLTFSATVEVPPIVELADYKNLSITAEEIAYNSQQVEDWLEQQREKQATLIPVEDRPAQAGDIAIIDYQGYGVDEEGKRGETMPDFQATDFQVELTEGRLIPGMGEGIVGMNLDETKEVSVIFPEDYAREQVAGKPAIFRITLKELKEKELPELDDEFAEEVSASKFETIAELRESLEKQFQEEVAEKNKQNIQVAIVEKLLEICQCDLPETIVNEQITQILTQSLMQMQQSGVDMKQILTPELVSKLREETRPQAIQSLKEYLILQEIAQVEHLKVRENEIDTELRKVAEKLSDREVDFNQLREMITAQLLKEKTLGWLQEKVTVELIPEGTLSKSAEAAEETKEKEKKADLSTTTRATTAAKAAKSEEE